MKGPLRFLALVAWGAFLMFIGHRFGVWVRDAPSIAISSLTVQAAGIAAAQGWQWPIGEIKRGRVMTHRFRTL